jgi:GNAT superfamily N-acetyltransferase
VIRDAQPEDAAAIADVRARGWRAAYAHVFPRDALAGMPADGDLQFWAQLLRDQPARCATVVAERGGEVTGFASVGPARGEECGELYAIYVDPARWGTGLGRALLEAAEDRLSSTAFTEAILWVLDDNPRARRFYQAAGWAADGGTKRDTFLGTEIEEVRYRKTLI